MANNQNTGRCCTCKKDKSVADFTRHSGTKNGLNKRCRQCQTEGIEKIRSQRRAENRCIWCGKMPVTTGRASCENCCAKRLEKRKARERDRVSAGLCRDCPRPREGHPAVCELCRRRLVLASRKNRETDRAMVVRQSRLSYIRVRQRVIDAYGGKCACCGESRTEFLAIDHTNNDGAKHRRELGKRTIYSFLSKNGFPLGFRVLCHNCNSALGFYGYCPHQTKITRNDAVEKGIMGVNRSKKSRRH